MARGCDKLCARKPLTTATSFWVLITDDFLQRCILKKIVEVGSDGTAAATETQQLYVCRVPIAS